MTISDRNINLRAPERTHSRLRTLMDLFERNRTWTVLEAADLFFEFMFTPHKLVDRYEEWQPFFRKIAQHTATPQMRILFPPHPDDVTFFPRFGPQRQSERQQETVAV